MQTCRCQSIGSDGTSRICEGGHEIITGGNTCSFHSGMAVQLVESSGVSAIGWNTCLFLKLAGERTT